jgi:hypothetical protein
MLIFVAPALFSMIGALGRQSLYERLEDINAAHATRRAEVEGEIREREHKLAATVRAAEAAEREISHSQRFAP